MAAGREPASAPGTAHTRVLSRVYMTRHNSESSTDIASADRALCRGGTCSAKCHQSWQRRQGLPS